MSSSITSNASGVTLPSNFYITNNTKTNTSIDSNLITTGSTSLVVNGRDVMAELDEMRDVLLLLKRDVDMEAKYPRLKELKEEYERALEKYKTFETLKESE